MVDPASDFKERHRKEDDVADKDARKGLGHNMSKQPRVSQVFTRTIMENQLQDVLNFNP